MTADRYSKERFTALAREHETTIEVIAAIFHHPASYAFHAMVCDLTTFLWRVSCALPDDKVIRDKPAWVYTILYRKAVNLNRNEDRRQRRMVYGADLSNIADGSGLDPHVARLYYLIDRLSDGDKELVMQYLSEGSTRRVAAATGLKQLVVRRRLAKICEKLRRLNESLGYDND